ncbi:MAG: tyrosine--tRNA ligase [Candidatus Gracilibacteria bacterium]
MSDPILELLNRGTVDVIVREDLEKKLRSKKKMRIKFGIDPTGSVLHIGHAVVLRKLRQFQDLGHTVIFLIGDFTAKIGDPTGRSAQRPPMTDEQIQQNMKDYIGQAGIVLDMDKVEVRHNSEWLGKLNFKDLIVLSSKVTYAQIAQRADFKQRIQNDIDLSLQEFLYPIMQGYDSVALESSVELGGTDQKFNLLMGRQIQERYEQEPQNVLTCPILEGLDGVQKMSKSLNNYIALTEAPNDMYGKVMSIPDALLLRWFELATSVSMDEIEKMKKELEAGINPRDLKMRLGRELVTLYHGVTEAKAAEENFVKVFSQKEIPDEIPEVKAPKLEMTIVELLRLFPSVSSNSDARRLVEGGGVRVNSQVQTDVDAKIKISEGEGLLLQAGKRRFLKVKRG